MTRKGAGGEGWVSTKCLEDIAEYFKQKKYVFCWNSITRYNPTAPMRWENQPKTGFWKKNSE